MGFIDVAAELERVIEFPPPRALVDVVGRFVEKAGSFDEGAELVRCTLDLGTGLQSAIEYRGYESTPVEFFGFLGTGGDGEAYGYVVHAPELGGDDFPLADHSPTHSDGLVYAGESTRDGFEMQISQRLAYDAGERPGVDFYELARERGLDLDWLETFGIRPSLEKGASSRQLVDATYVRPRPVVPPGWRHVMTSDGVGVLAERARFAETSPRRWSFADNLESFLSEADRAMRDGHAGSALVHLKEAWRHGYFAWPPSDLSVLRERLCGAYAALGKTVLAETMRRAFHWL